MASTLDVLQAEKHFFDALVRGRTAELELLLTEDFSLCDLSGQLLTKLVLIQIIASGQLQFDGIEPGEPVIRFYGGTAIVTGQTQMRGRFSISAFSARSQYTHVYIEQDGQLRLAAAQGTPIVSG
jgi:hypothetical protein